ncbi:hypothetical protein BCR35DRAFT_352048 [Leucosporidium creatinivorum]|uniref:Uncharacterized protein n=1 Tax=Leucosporidium creatinivorum TaxID=106004 RepID=A0A1Y2FJN9_9BASI|nr:hypothetical protein BCR35DRAFT_352048 [Leucosporidium creatinivorum]
MSVHSHSSLSVGSTESSTRRSEGGGGEGGVEWDDEDPSFSSAHFHTSTPLKSARAIRLERSSAEDEDEDEPDEEEEGMLRASDTESVEMEMEVEDNNKSNTRLRLTRRSLSLSSYSPTTSQQTLAQSRPFSPNSTTPRPPASTNLQPYPSHLVPGYTPSPSTGSSTLVDKDDHPSLSSLSTRTAKGKGREDVTIRPSASRGVISTLEEEEVPHHDDDGSSSSPRPLRSKPRKGGVELSSYINSHTSTPPPSSRSSHPSRSSYNSNPSTPLAPGAYPPTARKPFPRRSPPSSTTHDTPPPPAGTRQVHDAFQRYITGPSGALIHSAERRAAAAAAAMIVPPSAARRKDYDQQREPPTPHPAGYYAFEPSTSLPVERDQRRVREGLPSSEERRRREVTWREDVAGGEEEDEEEEEARAGDSPSNRPSSRTAAPSKLEKTLRHMSQLQRETEGRRRIFEAPPPPPPNLDEYFAPTAEYEEEGRVEPPRARARDYEGSYSSEDEESDEVVPRQAGRSAIDFAMARSFAVSSGEHSQEDAALAQEEERLPSRVAPTPPVAAPSPPRSSRRSPFRPPSPPSPTLPELPPLPSPQSSPTKPRATLRRSPAAHDPPRHPPQPQPQPSPPRAPPQPSPPRAPLTTAISPPRTTRPRRPSFDTIPTSSTPPRRFVEPPAPAGTPLGVPSRAKSLSSSLQAPRSDPMPTPRRRATSLSPSRSPRGSSSPQDLVHEHDDSLPAIVADLASAVRALSSTSTPGAGGLRIDGLPVPRGSLAGVLARRKKESEGRTKSLEEELRELEGRAGGQAAARDQVLSRLGQAQEVERDLSAKIDDLMRSIEQMGQAVGNQVANVVQDTLHDEARQRTSWFAIAFIIQLVIFLIFTRISNARNADLYQTIYYDPFSPSLFHLSSAAYGDSSSVLPQTLELFGPRLGGGAVVDGTVGVVKGWFGGRLREVAAWGVETSTGGRGWVPS